MVTFVESAKADFHVLRPDFSPRRWVKSMSIGGKLMDVNEFWRPFETNIKSFNELVDVINQMMEKSIQHKTQFAWRGQVDASWALHSSLYRRLSLTKSKVIVEKDLADAESKILMELRRWGLHAPANIGRLSILNQLAMLQHYGAPTRLIDVSFNAWVGAWFAVEQKWSNAIPMYDDKDARLFAFDVTDRLINENKYQNWEDELNVPWEVDDPSSPVVQEGWTTSVFAWKPSSLDSRISAQNGGFLFGGVPSSKKMNGNTFQFPRYPNNKDGWWKIDEGRQACCLALRPHKFEGDGRGPVPHGALYTFRISADVKGQIRERLDKMFGYKHSTIYPDYTGFSNFGTSWLKSNA